MVPLVLTHSHICIPCNPTTGPQNHRGPKCMTYDHGWGQGGGVRTAALINMYIYIYVYICHATRGPQWAQFGKPNKINSALAKPPIQPPQPLSASFLELVVSNMGTPPKKSSMVSKPQVFSIHGVLLESVRFLEWQGCPFGFPLNTNPNRLSLEMLGFLQECMVSCQTCLVSCKSCWFPAKGAGFPAKNLQLPAKKNVWLPTKDL